MSQGAAASCPIWGPKPKLPTGGAYHTRIMLTTATTTITTRTLQENILHTKDQPKQKAPVFTTFSPLADSPQRTALMMKKSSSARPMPSTAALASSAASLSPCLGQGRGAPTKSPRNPELHLLRSVCTCVHIYTYVYIHICIYIHICTYTYIYTYIYV